MPKFVFYSAHAEEIYPLLSAFDHLLITEAPPASAVFLEFYEENDQDKVQILFKENATSSVELLGGEMLVTEF